MEKLVYLVWDRPSRGADDLRTELLSSIVPALTDAGAQRIEAFVGDLDVPGPLPAPGDRLPVRLAVTFWVDCYDRREPVEAVLRSRGIRTAGYLVTESTWTEYGSNGRRGPRDWPAGTRSPGVTTFSTLRQNPNIDPRTFREFWHGHQSPMSEELQPRHRYVRHTVVHPLTTGAPPIDAIVHESWPSTDLLSDIVGFHNGDAENIRIMMDSVGQVFDLAELRSEAMSEYLFWD